MHRRAFIGAVIIFVSLVSGCASVPMASKEEDAALKKFAPPPAGKAGLYIYRNSFVGQALRKRVSVDGVVLGETANKTFFYRAVAPGEHKLDTETEFGDNSITLMAAVGKNYFVQQYIKMGAFSGGAGLKIVSEEEGKKEVLNCELAK